MEKSKVYFTDFRTDLDVPDYMTVQSVHLSESLMQLSYKINH